MAHALFIAFLLMGSSAVSAQFETAPGVEGGVGGVTLGSDFINNNALAPSAPLFGRTTPADEKERLRRALALRKEAFALQAADGGALSEKHKRYINRKAVRILQS